MPKPSDGAGVQVTIETDAEYFADPATKYPVVVDPQVNPLYTTFDTYVKQSDTVDRSGTADLQLGIVGGDVARSIVRWDGSKLVGKQITAATVYFYNWWSHSCTASTWEIWTTGAASADTRWSNQPTWNNREATSTATKGGSGCADGWVTVSGTSFFQRAAAAGTARPHMGIRATARQGSGGNICDCRQVELVELADRLRSDFPTGHRSGAAHHQRSSFAGQRGDAGRSRLANPVGGFLVLVAADSEGLALDLHPAIDVVSSLYSSGMR